EYATAINRDAQVRQSERDRLDALLIGGLESSPASPLTESWRGSPRLQSWEESPPWSRILSDPVYNRRMKLTLQIQLLPGRDHAARLKATLERFNEAANWAAGIAFEHQCSNKIELQKIVYRELRERFGLSSQMAVRCIAQVCEAYKRDKSIRP